MTKAGARAHQTLCRAAGFFASWSAPHATIAHELRSRALGNGLCELDRFLNLLIDEIARAHGLEATPRERHTANKLRRLRERMGLTDTDHARLIALGRSRDCLSHCAGIARKADAGAPGFMTLGWPGKSDRPGALRRVPLGRAVVLGPAEVASIRDLYAGISASLALRA